VRQGRRKEFAAFRWQGEPPDPQDEATFLRAKLNHHLRYEGHHRILLEFYKELIWLRKEVPSLAHLSKDALEVLGHEKAKVLFVRRWQDDDEVFTTFSFGDSPVSVPLPVPAGRWHKVLDSAEERWQGRGSSVPQELLSEGEFILTLDPKAFALFTRTEKA